MAIKIGGNTVIDNSSNLIAKSIQFNDGSILTENGKLGKDIYGVADLLYTKVQNSTISSIAISNKYTICSSSGESVNGVTGIIYVYDTVTGTLLHRIYNPDVTTSNKFGSVLAVDNDVIAVGCTDTAVYVYNAKSGALLRKITSTVVTSNFGTSIAISGNNLMIGSYLYSSSSGIVHIYDITTGSLLRTLSNANAYSTTSNDFFGFSIGISGNYAIVGAYGEDELNNLTSGKAYIYNVTTGSRLFTLNNPNVQSTAAGDSFGYSVAVSGNYAIVGAIAEDTAATTDSGRAYIYNVTTGTRLFTLDNPDPANSDNFGSSVAISGNYAIVGASNSDDGSQTNTGRLYIFNVITGKLVYTIQNPILDTLQSANSKYSNSIAMCGNFIASSTADPARLFVHTISPLVDFSYVEEIQFNNTAQINYLTDKTFEIVYTSGELINTLTSPNPVNDGKFGTSVSIHNNYSIVGATGENVGRIYLFNTTSGALINTLNNPQSNSTKFSEKISLYNNTIVTYGINANALSEIYIYNAKTGQVLNTLYITNASDIHVTDTYIAYSNVPNGSATVNLMTGEIASITSNPGQSGNLFGTSISISSNALVIGAPNQNSSGSVYYYWIRQNGTSTYLAATIDEPANSANSYFGYAVDISDDNVIIGAYGTNNIGKAYIYKTSSTSIVYTLSSPNESTGGNFGFSVAIDGDYAVVGAPGENSGSGNVYIFNAKSGDLLHTLNNPNVYGTADGDNFGSSVDISGNYVIIGAPNEDSTNSNSGRAYIYSIADQTYLDKIVNIGNSIF